MPPQQAITEPAPMEGVERINMVVVRGSEQEIETSRWNPYAMKIDWGRNCYAYGGFGHMACHCKNRRRGRTMKERRVEYGKERIEEINEYLNNLKEMENLKFLN